MTDLRTPNHVGDDTINQLFELAAGLVREQAANAETAFVDLQRRYKIKTERRPSLYRLPEWSAIDELTFDPDPCSRNHVIGTGSCEQDAKLDLLERLAS